MSYENVKQKLGHLIYCKRPDNNSVVILSQDKLQELKAWCKNGKDLIMRDKEPNQFMGLPIIVVETKDGIAELGHYY